MCFIKTQIETAKRLGMIAFARGAECVPDHDLKLMGMLEDRAAGVTPNNEASSRMILNAWSSSWKSSEALKSQERDFNDPKKTSFDKLLQLLSEKDAKYPLRKLVLLSGRKESTVKHTLSQIRSSGVNVVCNNKNEYLIQ